MNVSVFGFAFEAPISDFVVVGLMFLGLVVFELRMRFVEAHGPSAVGSTDGDQEPSITRA